MKNIEGVFKAIEKDGSGELDHAEFTMAMNRLGLGLSKEQIVQCIEVLDIDGDGDIDVLVLDLSSGTADVHGNVNDATTVRRSASHSARTRLFECLTQCPHAPI